MPPGTNALADTPTESGVAPGYVTCSGTVLLVFNLRHLCKIRLCVHKNTRLTYVYLSCVLQDNVTVFTGGCDNAIKMWNVTQGPTAAQVIGKHDAPVR
jgi:WD40 repeat protein